MKRGRKTSQTRKAFIMKKTSLQSLVSYLNGETVDNIAEIKAEIEAELAKGDARKAKTAQGYDEAHDVIVNALGDTPVTCGELYDAIKDELPEGFGKGKVQWALTNLWGDEIVKIEGKPNTYRRNW